MKCSGIDRLSDRLDAGTVMDGNQSHLKHGHMIITATLFRLCSSRDLLNIVEGLGEVFLVHIINLRIEGDAKLIGLSKKT